MQRIGVMGGTFDPIHHGHLVAASEVAASFDLDEVVFVPTGAPWQKTDRAVSPAEDRYLMTVIATASDPRFSVSRVDVDRDGPTYTLDTLRDLQAAHPKAGQLYFITGADALAQLLTWRDVEALFALAHFVGVTRPGHVLADPGLPSGEVSLVEVPALAISSTDVRDRVASGRPIDYLVPEGVGRYIAKRGLYRQDARMTERHRHRPDKKADKARRAKPRVRALRVRPDVARTASRWPTGSVARPRPDRARRRYFPPAPRPRRSGRRPASSYVSSAKSSNVRPSNDGWSPVLPSSGSSCSERFSSSGLPDAVKIRPHLTRLAALSARSR